MFKNIRILVLWLTFSGVVMGFTIPPTYFSNNSELKNSVMKTKKCTKCSNNKYLSEYYKDKGNHTGYSTWCKECSVKYGIKRRRQKKYVINEIYWSQVKKSKKRNHIKPNYTKQELEKWAYSQPLYHIIYNNWVLSNYKKGLKPSVDRKNDYKSYTLGNLNPITTWGKHNKKSNEDVKNGLNNKRSKAVLQYDLKGRYVNEYYSIKEASRQTGVSSGNISGCCKKSIRVGNKNKEYFVLSAGGYKWKYKC